MSHQFETSDGSNFKGFRKRSEDNQPSRTALLVAPKVLENYWARTIKDEVRRVHVKPRNQLYLPFDAYDCPIEPKFFKDTRITFMSRVVEDGSTSETLYHDSWRCLDDASDGRQDFEWTGYISFQVSKRYGRRCQEPEEQASSMFLLAVIPKEPKTGKVSVDVFDKVQIRSQPCKNDKRIRVETKTGTHGVYSSSIELELCDEDQDNANIGNIHIVLISADEKKPRLVLVCSEETNWLTRLEEAIGQ